MSRLLTAVALLLISGNVVVATAQTGVPASPAEFVIHGPTFRYILKEDRNPAVCTHILRLFNDKFAHLWDAPPMPWSKTDQWYSADSKYGFPLLPGVKHSTEATFEMRFSAWPTSPEFSAIHWKEGRAVPGGCPAGKTCPGEGPIPILVAYFDFDNDGLTDTVIKSAFNSNKYSPNDVLEVWRGQTLKITGTPSLWDLAHPQDKKLTPIIMWGAHLRSFIYRGVAYVANYQADYADLSAPASETPLPIVGEDMLINRYHFAGQKDQIGRPEWNSDTVCDLRMKRRKN